MAAKGSDGSGLSWFSPPTRQWFTQAFATPTSAQTMAWESIAEGNHTLVVAPTGSGKTLAAFLSALDQIAENPHTGPASRRCRVLYISPLRALASDVERNLRSPLVGINRVREQLGLSRADVTVDVRTSDTSPAQRRRQATHPADILITTPESLFLILTSQAREALRGVNTVIVDEIHAVAGTKRGAHLAVSLERLDDLTDAPALRVGLSATVRPPAEVARFLGGVAPVQVVEPPADKTLELRVEVPVPDLTAPPQALESDDIHDAPAADPSIWPHVQRRIVELIDTHQATLVFANSRRLAERLTARLNEISADTTHELAPSLPAEVMAQAGQTAGAPPEIARAHHGSVSKEQRKLIEESLKAGQLPAVVATSSLELGIDMGSVDLVIQVEAPPSVAGGLQRIGRAGHQVGEVSRAVFFPKHRGDLLTTAALVELITERAIEPLRVVSNPLDVLAQQIVSMVAMAETVPVDQLFTTVRRSAPFSSLSRNVFESVLDMLSGRYPSQDFSELRPRMVWDRTTDVVSARPGAQRIAVTSGGTIPDRGLFGVFMVGEKQTRVGELDEEMVYESRVGDVFALGATSWRIEDITADRVLVSPAPGRSGKLPFWHGDALGRPPETGVAIGQLLQRAVSDRPPLRDELADHGLDDWALDNLFAYLDEQVASTGALPTNKRLIVEYFRDEVGDWRIVLHSPFGARVHAPWALAASRRLEQETGIDAQVMHADDGIVLRLPDTDDQLTISAAIECLRLDADTISEIVTASLASSPLFASRFRECAARALLLPRRTPGKRTPLWQQRQRSAQLLSVAAKYPEFPIVLETVRECLQDVYDLPFLEQVLRDIQSREIDVVAVETNVPSPFARTLLFDYVASFIYEGDSPLAERRAAALTLDTELLAELLGFTELRELLETEALVEVGQWISYLDPARHPQDCEQTADLLRVLGPLSDADQRDRAIQPEWIVELLRTRRAINVQLAHGPAVAAIEDAGLLRDALGVALPTGIPEAYLEPVERPLHWLVARFARTHAPFTVADVANNFGLGTAVVSAVLTDLAAEGKVVSGEFTPGRTGSEWSDAIVLQRIRRRSISLLRDETEPVAPETVGRFLPFWQHIDRPLRGVDGVYDVISQLSGTPVAASCLEQIVLPSRVSDYQPAMLDELIATGDVSWTGAGSLSDNDGWLVLATAERLTCLPPAPAVGSEAELEIIQLLQSGGAWLSQEIASRVGLDEPATETALWALLWRGHLTNDTLAPVRARLTSGRTGGKRPTLARGAGSRHGRRRISRPAAVSQRQAPGRWSLLNMNEYGTTEQMATRAEVMQDRYGIVTRAVVSNEPIPGGYGTLYRTLSALEDIGKARRGYFIEGLGGAQFALAGAVDQLRNLSASRSASPTSAPVVHVLAATDPANPYGGALPWPASRLDALTNHRPGRKVGAHVVLVDGALACYLEKGGKSLLVFCEDETMIRLAMDAIGRKISQRRLLSAHVEKINGEPIGTHPVRTVMEAAGFTLTPKGLTYRAGR